MTEHRSHSPEPDQKPLRRTKVDQKPLAAARAGDFMRLADSLRLALEIAGIAVTALERADAEPALTVQLHRQIAALKRSL